MLRNPHRMFAAALTAMAVVALVAAPARAGKARNQPLPGPEVVGTSQPIAVTPDLARALEVDGVSRWSREVRVPGATFLKPHFVNVNLRAGDVLIVRSASGRVVEEISGRGPKEMGNFWGLSAFGEALSLELVFRHAYLQPPFRVDQVIVGEADLLAPPPPPEGPESICTPADFEDVICYQGDAGKWANVQASVGVMSVGGNPNSALFCSGSNVSPQNYVLTNAHCIGSQSGCTGAEFVFRFYRTGCNDGSPPTTDWQSFRCDEMVATSPFVSCDQGLNDLDFSLNSVIGDPAATFGFATPDPNPLTDGEAIYIVQHPDGRPHEITHGSGGDVDVDGTVLRYYNTLDTEGGSSGSPIFREADDKLVGLHHCGGCSTPGTGNRGMLMSDIYPHIEPFICSTTLSVLPDGYQDLAEVSGNGDAVIDPGEIWQFRPRVKNVSCSAVAEGVEARFQLGALSGQPVVLLDSRAGFGDVPAATGAAAGAPLRFAVGAAVPCPSQVVVDLVSLSATNGGPFSGQSEFLTAGVGELVTTALLAEDFAAGIPAGWTVVDGGTGSGPAQTWTTANPGNRSVGLTEPFAIADSDNLGTGQSMDEELISPTVDTSGYAQVLLQFMHDFRWYNASQDEQCDVDVRSTATGGSWVNVANYSGASASGMVQIDVTAQAAGQTDFQVRFHYYNAEFEWWWAVDDVFVLGSNGYQCDPVVGGELLFLDTFESGDVSLWSDSAP